jgi:AAA+ ATPase superfamily predicted ATPase
MQVIITRVIKMKFYNREEELKVLQKADRLSKKHSVMSILIGRRRIGKTALALKINQDAIYFFTSKKDETLLCDEFISELASNGIKVFGQFHKFEELFAYVLEVSKSRPITLIIDEFQYFYKVNPNIFASMQKLWDLNKKETKLHLMICGSVYSLMRKIFEDSKEPLFGRADFKVSLKPLKANVLKEILQDNNSYTKENLLDLYTITGGVAKYLELFVLYETFTLDDMINEIASPNSLFLDEGKNRLIEEFGKEYMIYFSILSLMAASKTSRSEIESVLQKNISGYLERLDKDYDVIKPLKPINAKPNSKTQKYEIVDNFINFWFRFIYKYQSIIEAGNFVALKEIIIRDFSTYKGKYLEKLFREIFVDAGIYTQLGNYWERGNKNEIDIVGINELKKELDIYEVKLNPKKLNKNELILKSANLIKDYKDYKIEYKLLSLDDLI